MLQALRRRDKPASLPLLLGFCRCSVPRSQPRYPGAAKKSRPKKRSLTQEAIEWRWWGYWSQESRRSRNFSMMMMYNDGRPTESEDVGVGEQLEAFLLDCLYCYLLKWSNTTLFKYRLPKTSNQKICCFVDWFISDRHMCAKKRETAKSVAVLPVCILLSRIFGIDLVILLWQILCTALHFF